MALASDGANLYAIGGDANGGTYFDPTSEVDQYNPSVWPGGSWTVNPNNLPATRQGNSAGFYSMTTDGGAIWSIGGIAGGITLSDNLYLVTVPSTPTPAATATPISTGTPPPPSPTPTGCSNGANGAPHTIGLGAPGQVNVVHQPANQTGMRLSSSTRGAHAIGRWSPNGTISFVLDDGSQETSIGLNNNSTSYPAIWLNRFSPMSSDYPIRLSQISILWPNQAEANVNLVGKTVDLLVYLDHDADNNPANASRIAQVVNQTITVADGVTFQDFTVDITINGPGDLYIGFSDTYNHGGVSPQSYPAPLDTNNSQVRSWVAGRSGASDPDYTNLGNNNLLGTIDGFGFAGNWAIRASGTTNSPCALTSPMPTNTPGGPTPTDCPNVFVDINGNVFYTAIHFLNCRGVINGTDATHYSPAGTSTRGQFAKVVVLGFGLPFYTPTSGQDFTDVPPSYFAWLYIETGFHAGILSGFDPANCTSHNAAFPCYLPNIPITRGQLTKLVVNAGGYALYTPTGGIQDFIDVPPSNIFYTSIETAYHNGIINGYPDHTFRPSNNIRRDEMAQIVYKGVTSEPVTPTPTPCGGSDLVSNGGFETGSFSPWVILDTNPTPLVVTTQAHSGTRSAQIGKPFPGAPEPLGDSSIYQTVNVPTAGATLSYWYWPYTLDQINFDWQDAYVENTSGTILATLMHTAENDQTWKRKTFDLGAYAGQTVRIAFLVHEDGYSGADNTGMYVDDVSLISNGCATPTSTVTGTPPTATPIQTATPTQCGGSSLWVTVTPGPMDLYGAGATSDGTNAYFAGGYRFSTGSETNQFARYNPSSGTWSTLAPVPNNGANEMASAVYSPLNNKVYVMGGGTTSGNVYNDNRIYDVSSGNWSAGAAMPDIRAFAASGYYNGKIYIIGGYSTGSITPAYDQVWEYDVTANTWLTKTAMPHALGGAGYGVIGGHLYVAGGRDAANNVLNSLYDYNIAADSWTARTPMPTAENVPGAAVLNGKLYVFGGGNPFNRSDNRAFNPDRVDTTNATMVYDPGSNAWTNGPVMNTPRAFPAGTNVGNQAIAYGGYNGSNTTASAEVLNGGSPCSTATPTPTNTPPPVTLTPTLTPIPCLGPNLIQNPGFETGSFAPWVISDTVAPSVVSNAQAHSGTYSALLGNLSGTEPNGYSSIYQQVTVPTGGGTLSYWYWPFTTDSITFDWQDAYVENTSGAILATVMHVDYNFQAWTHISFDMTPYAGQTVRIVFLVHEDGFGDDTAMYVDDVSLQASVACGTPTVIPTNIPSPSSTPCSSSWNVVTSPNVGTSDNYLIGVTAISSSDVWAVGHYYNGSVFQTLTEHWNGSSWSVVPSPNVGTGGNSLEVVTAISSSDVWATGFYGGVRQTLTEHWNGSSWSVIPSPSPSSYDNYLVGVTAISSNDVWAVGGYGDYSSGARQTLTEHWDGSSWSVVPSPNVGTSTNMLGEVIAISSNDVWTVGSYVNGSAYQTLTEHWNGSSWSIVPSPNVGTSNNFLAGVSAISSSDVWTVGGYYSSSGYYQTLAEHWNGSSWSVVTSPNVGTNNNYLNRVTAISSGDVWAVGYYGGGTLTEHWDGSSWSVVPSPNVGTSDNVLDVSAISSSDVWAVGQYYNGSVYQTLAEHYSAPGCATPTPLPPTDTPVLPTDTLIPPTSTPNGLINTSVLPTAINTPILLRCGWRHRRHPLYVSRHQYARSVRQSGCTPASVFYTSIETAYHNGIINGYPGGIFLPQQQHSSRPDGPDCLRRYHSPTLMAHSALARTSHVAGCVILICYGAGVKRMGAINPRPYG